MAYGKRAEDWDHTSLVAALVHNGAPGQSQPLQAADFHPLRTVNEKRCGGPERVKISVEDFARLTGGRLEIIK